MSNTLKSMLNNLINEKNDQAQMDLHDFITEKMKHMIHNNKAVTESNDASSLVGKFLVLTCDIKYEGNSIKTGKAVKDSAKVIFWAPVTAKHVADEEDAERLELFPQVVKNYSARNLIETVINDIDDLEITHESLSAKFAASAPAVGKMVIETNVNEIIGEVQ